VWKGETWGPFPRAQFPQARAEGLRVTRRSGKPILKRRQLSRGKKKTGSRVWPTEVHKNRWFPQKNLRQKGAIRKKNEKLNNCHCQSEGEVKTERKTFQEAKTDEKAAS